MSRGRVSSQPGAVPLKKASTGIAGLDEITGGGLPLGRTTLVVGGPGTGKTVLALQTLIHGARNHDEPGIFVAFEENSRQILANAATFGWDLVGLQREKLFFLDARLSPTNVRVGEFELTGILATLSAKVRELKARRIVLDSLDVLLCLLDNQVAERQEVHRLHAWLLESGLTGILTAKTGGAGLLAEHHYGFMQYLADAVIRLEHRLQDRVSVRSLRVLKYRGSGFADNEFAVVFGPAGLDVTGTGQLVEPERVASERVSTGVSQLDAMLQGGPYRGSSLLISGSPGTAKSTLAAAMVEAACRRGEQAVFHCFDEGAAEMVRNLTSVGIRLAPHVEGGRLQVLTAQSESRSSEEHLLRIRNLLEAFRPHLVVLDPVSALLKAGGETTAMLALQRLQRQAKSRGVTMLWTSVLSEHDALVEATPLPISTLADVWIHLSNVVHGGERNRALTVVKARGTKHSNQVRELLLGEDGIRIAEVYTAGGEVLMGTARWERELAERLAAERTDADLERQERRLAARLAATQARIDALKRAVESQQAEAVRLQQERALRQRVQHDRVEELLRRRGGDPAASSPMPTRKR